MGFAYQERPSNSPFAAAVWRTEDTADGLYLAAASDSWDLIFVTEGDETKVFLRGPSSRATPVPYKNGNRNLGIRLKSGSFMPGLSTTKMLDITSTLPKRSKRSFWFQGQDWEIPTFDNADEYLAKMANSGLLASDGIVTAVLGDVRRSVSERTIQRHFLLATGLPRQYVQNIHRAHRAVSLLQQGETIIDVVAELGYADQAHMTHQVKHVSGCTPGEIVKKLAACRLRSIQGYGACAAMRVQNFKGASYHDTIIRNRKMIRAQKTALKAAAPPMDASWDYPYN